MGLFNDLRQLPLVHETPVNVYFNAPVERLALHVVHDGRNLAHVLARRQPHLVDLALDDAAVATLEFLLLVVDPLLLDVERGPVLHEARGDALHGRGAALQVRDAVQPRIEPTLLELHEIEALAEVGVYFERLARRRLVRVRR